MGIHDRYGKDVLKLAAGDQFSEYGRSVQVDFGDGHPARIDGTVGDKVAVEVDSREPKQIRGAIVDLVWHSYPKKLLVIIPKYAGNPTITRNKCENILARWCNKRNFRVVVLKGDGGNRKTKTDRKIVYQALRELRVL